MPYTIKSRYNRGDANNTEGQITVNDGSTTGDSYPIEFIGNNYINYSPKIANSFLDLLENFRGNTAPMNPREGMFWYNNANMQFRAGDSWSPVLSANSALSLFSQENAIEEPIDLTVRPVNLDSSPVIFRHPDPSGDVRYYPTNIILQVINANNITNPALIALHTTTSEDILNDVSVSAKNSGEFIHYIIQGNTRSISTSTGNNEIKMEIKKPSNGNFTVNAFIFGWVK